MFCKIPRFFIKELVSRTNIIDLINSRFLLTKYGNNFRAHCPFHDEKTPSFIVHNEKQFYHCFGCGAHGNVIDFLINYDRLSFIESIEELAIINNFKVPYKINNFNSKEQFYQNYKQRDTLYKIMENLKNFYVKNLQNKKFFLANNYLINRGLNYNTINLFSIGYASPFWNNIPKYDDIDNKINKFLIESGIVFKNNKGYLYDFFRNRIMFPIRDKHGRTIGFGGRVIDNSKPKYLNSTETLIFQKKRQLYGLFEIHKNYYHHNYILIVEGYMDVIMLSQHGINCAVSSLGTCTSTEHIQMIFRITNKIICCYDGDNAGREAAWRLLIISLPYMNTDRQLKFIFLPENEDPDTLIRKKGKNTFEKYINNAISFTTFLFDKLLLNVDLSTSDGKANFSANLIPLISKIPNETLRIYLYQELGNKLGILDLQHLKKFILKQKKIALKNNQNVNDNNTLSILNSRILRILISLIIQHPKLSRLVTSNFIKNFKTSKILGMSFFLELINVCQNNINLNTGQLMELYRGTNFFITLETLSIWNHMIVDKKIEAVFQDSLNKVYNLILQQQLDSLISRDRIKKLNNKERKEFLILSQSIVKK